MTDSASSTATPVSSIDPDEVARFSALAAEWWDPKGKFGVLHKFNPVRLAYSREAVPHFGLDEKLAHPFQGLRILDIGCGGGLICEPMARLAQRSSASMRPKRTSTPHRFTHRNKA